MTKAIIHLKPITVEVPKNLTGDQFIQLSPHQQMSFVENVVDNGGLHIDKIEIDETRNT